MQRILFVETSATSRHALSRRLKRGDYDVDVEMGFEDGIARLTAEPSDTYNGVIIGWPSKTMASSDEMLATLSEPPYSDIAVLVLSHEPDPAKLAWVSGRKRTGFLLWSSYEEATQILGTLLSDEVPSFTHLDAMDAEPIRVLLVDDSPTARVKFRRLLDAQGLQTATASSPEEALKITETESFDIAIIDYFMPNMTGDRLCRQFLENPGTAGMMIAMLTSTYLDKVISDSLAAGAIECMFKSEADELFQTRVASISRIVQTSRRIERERQRLDGILTSVGDGVYGVDSDNEITFANPAAIRILGYQRSQQLIGESPAALFHKSFSNQPNEHLDAAHLYQRIGQGEEMQAVESVFVCADGREIQVELTVFPLHIEGQKQGAVVAFRDISERKLLEEELKWQVNHDSLTKLLNRNYFEDALDQEVRRLERSEEQSALLYIDLDRFKYINDTAGHAIGDQLLIEIGHQLRGRLRHADLLARIGGDEFAVILRNIDHDNLMRCADEFRDLLNDYTFSYGGRSYTVTASIGVAVIDSTTESPGEILANADIACHAAKSGGRNRTHLFEPETEQKAAMDLELGWSNRLHRALENDGFRLVFQPILPMQHLHGMELPREQGQLWEHLNADTLPEGTIFEVLLRLTDNKDRRIPPGAFLPTAERFNLMPDLDRWVVVNALKAINEMRAAGVDTRLTVNLSGQSLSSNLIVDHVRESIEQGHVDAHALIFEITESSAIYNIDAARHLIGELSALGCRFALDDFGSGYCSFSHLKNLPVDYIKIDGMFVRNILNDPMDQAIVTSINEIAHSLGKKTVAECVETPEAVEFLLRCGVDYVQGYYVSRPMDAPLSETPRIDHSGVELTPRPGAAPA